MTGLRGRPASGSSITPSGRKTSRRSRIRSSPSPLIGYSSFLKITSRHQCRLFPTAQWLLTAPAHFLVSLRVFCRRGSFRNLNVLQNVVEFLPKTAAYWDTTENVAIIRRIVYNRIKMQLKPKERLCFGKRFCMYDDDYRLKIMFSHA